MAIKCFPKVAADGQFGRADDIGHPYPWNGAYNNRDTIADARPQAANVTIGKDPSPQHPQPPPAGGWLNGNIGWGFDSATPPTPTPAHVTPWTGLSNGRDK